MINVLFIYILSRVLRAFQQSRRRDADVDGLRTLLAARRLVMAGTTLLWPDSILRYISLRARRSITGGVTVTLQKTDPKRESWAEHFSARNATRVGRWTLFKLDLAAGAVVIGVQSRPKKCGPALEDLYHLIARFQALSLFYAKTLKCDSL